MKCDKMCYKKKMCPWAETCPDNPKIWEECLATFLAPLIILAVFIGFMIFMILIIITLI